MRTKHQKMFSSIFSMLQTNTGKQACFPTKKKKKKKNGFTIKLHNRVLKKYPITSHKLQISSTNQIAEK